MMNNNTPQLSIIVATYNADRFLSDALNSVMSLTYNNWECLIIDGASTDNTLNIILSFEKKNSRFRHISEPDKGLYDAFNKGWKNAKGKWIYYLGSDDRLTAEGISILMKHTENVAENFAIVSGGVIRIRQDGSEHILMSKGFIGSHQSMVMRRSVLHELHGFDYKKYAILADYDLFIRIKNHNYQVKNCDAIVAYFQAGGTSEKMKNIKKVVREKYKILKQDKYCNNPLWITLKDTFKTIAGSFYHNTLRK